MQCERVERGVQCTGEAIKGIDEDFVVRLLSEILYKDRHRYDFYCDKHAKEEEEYGYE